MTPCLSVFIRCRKIYRQVSNARKNLGKDLALPDIICIFTPIFKRGHRCLYAFICFYHGVYYESTKIRVKIWWFQLLLLPLRTWTKDVHLHWAFEPKLYLLLWWLKGSLLKSELWIQLFVRSAELRFLEDQDAKEMNMVTCIKLLIIHVHVAMGGYVIQTFN